MIDWSWVDHHGQLFWSLSRTHLYLAMISVLYGLVIAMVLGIACARFRFVYAPVLGLTTVLYAIPSLAMFVFLLNYTGASNETVIIPLTIYSLSVLVRNVVDGLGSVSEDVRLAATAMGFGPLQRLLRVELPAAVPVILAGLRVASVSSISLVSVGQLVGIGGLGYLFTDGANKDFPTEIWSGIVLIVVLALLVDLLLVAVGYLAAPWARSRRVRRRVRRRLRPGVGAAG